MQSLLTWIANHKIPAIIAGFMALMALIENVSGKENIGSYFWKWLTKMVTYPFLVSKKLDYLQKNIDKAFGLLIKIELQLFDLTQNNTLILEMLKVPFWISNNKGEAEYISKNLCMLMDRTEAEIRGNNWATWLHTKDANVFETWAETIKEKRMFDMNYTYRRKDGRYIDVNGCAFHKYNSEGIYIGSVGNLTAISEPYK